MIADGGLGADAQGHAKHLVASIHVFEQVVGGDDVRQHHDKGGGARLGQPQVTAEDRHRALAVALEQVADGEGPGQHDADVASDLDGAEQLFLVGEHRVEAPAAEDLGEDSGEVLDDGKRQGHLDERVHHLAEYHRRRPVLQAGGQQEAEDEQWRQQPKHAEEVQRQVVQGRRTGRYQFAHRDVVEGNQQQRRQHRERNADQPGHRPQRQVLVVLALEHGQADRDQVDDGRAGGVAHQHGGNPHVAVGGQGIGQLVAAHVHCDDRQRGDAGLGEEHRTDGVDAVDELAAQTAFRAQDGSQRAKYRTQHDQVNHIVSELGHLRRSPLGRLP